MIIKINTIMDVALKGLSLLFTFCMFMGVAVTWTYLNISNLGSEISSVISSPQVLLKIALISILVSVHTILIFFIAPILIKHCADASEFRWRNSSPSSEYIKHFFIACAPIVGLLLVAVAVDPIKENLAFIFIFLFSLCLLMSCFFYIWYDGTEEKEWSAAGNFLKLYFILLLVCLACIPLLYFFAILSQYLANSEIFQLVILGIFIIIHSALVAGVSSSSNRFFLNPSLIPLAIFAFAFLVIMFAYKASTNIVSQLGLGGFSGSYAVEAKNIAAISGASFDIGKTKNKDVVVLRNVWVVAKLPEKIIFSAEKDDKTTYTIPASAILVEFGDTNISAEATAKAPAPVD